MKRGASMCDTMSVTAVVKKPKLSPLPASTDSPTESPSKSGHQIVRQRLFMVQRAQSQGTFVSLLSGIIMDQRLSNRHLDVTLEYESSLGQPKLTRVSRFLLNVWCCLPSKSDYLIRVNVQDVPGPFVDDLIKFIHTGFSTVPYDHLIEVISNLLRIGIVSPWVIGLLAIQSVKQYSEEEVINLLRLAKSLSSLSSTPPPPPSPRSSPVHTFLQDCCVFRLFMIMDQGDFNYPVDVARELIKYDKFHLNNPDKVVCKALMMTNLSQNGYSLVPASGRLKKIRSLQSTIISAIQQLDRRNCQTLRFLDNKSQENQGVKLYSFGNVVNQLLENSFMTITNPLLMILQFLEPVQNPTSITPEILRFWSSHFASQSLEETVNFLNDQFHIEPDCMDAFERVKSLMLGTAPGCWGGIDGQLRDQMIGICQKLQVGNVIKLFFGVTPKIHHCLKCTSEIHAVAYQGFQLGLQNTLPHVASEHFFNLIRIMCTSLMKK